MIVEDHNEIAGPAGLHAMEASCLALITTDVYELRTSPDWRSGNSACLFAPEEFEVQLPVEEERGAIPKAFFGDEGGKGRWCKRYGSA